MSPSKRRRPGQYIQSSKGQLTAGPRSGTLTREYFPFVFKSQNGCASTIQVAPPTSPTRAPSRCRWTPRRQERSYTSQSHV